MKTTNEIVCRVWTKEGHRDLTKDEWLEFDDSLLHREDGPAVEHGDGTKEWWVNGQIHRLDGPAFECADGSAKWWVNGQIHRLDGPAVEYPNGSASWWVNGKCLDIDEVETWLKENNIDLKTQEGQMAFKLRWT